MAFLLINRADAQAEWVINSSYLEKPGSVSVFHPQSYQSSRTYPLIYLLHGYSMDYRQWSGTADLQKLSNEFDLVIVCPEGGASFYLNSPYNPASQWEDFFWKELVPKVHKTYRIDPNNIFISGLSVGGYGALRCFLLHPNYFRSAGSTSGTLEFNYQFASIISQSFFLSDRMVKDLLNRLGEDTTRWNQFNLISLLEAQGDFKRPFIIDCGTDDPVYSNTLNLMEYCKCNNIPVTTILQPGNHATEYWERSIVQHLQYFKLQIKPSDR